MPTSGENAGLSIRKGLAFGERSGALPSVIVSKRQWPARSAEGHAARPDGAPAVIAIVAKKRSLMHGICFPH